MRKLQIFIHVQKGNRYKIRLLQNRLRAERKDDEQRNPQSIKPYPKAACGVARYKPNRNKLYRTRLYSVRRTYKATHPLLSNVLQIKGGEGWGKVFPPAIAAKVSKKLVKMVDFFKDTSYNNE